MRLDYNYAIMHDRFTLVDGHGEKTGSFNFTAAEGEKMRRTF